MAKHKSVHQELRKKLRCWLRMLKHHRGNGGTGQNASFPGSNGLGFNDFMVHRSDFKLKMSL
ncbi:MAG TPA: hypothetical protein VMO20_01050, partial [Candidatus Acidoferrum sp.]|nr:hypothetical protein [Candidatus Acidoferrum sp.]